LLISYAVEDSVVGAVACAEVEAINDAIVRRGINGSVIARLKRPLTENKSLDLSLERGYATANQQHK